MKLDDAFGARRLHSRWIFCAELVLDTPAHFGGSEDGSADMTLLRQRDGTPLLPATSIAGALRSHLADRLGGYYTDEHPAVQRLFGWRGDGATDGPQSSAIVFDSRAESRGAEIRDGVAIDSKKGVAAQNFKYDIEILPAGTCFPLRIDLLVPENGDAASLACCFTSANPPTLEHALASLLGTAIEGFSDCHFAIGARRSRGMGRFTCSAISIRSFSLTSKEGWIEWVMQDHGNPVGGTNEPWPLAEMASVIDQRRRVVAEIDLSIDGELQIAGPSEEVNGPDVGHLRSAGHPVLPATSLAGAMRNRAMRIARVVRPGDAGSWVDRLFGPANGPLSHVPGGAPDLHASRIRIAESQIVGYASVRPSRIQIDRFTQGVYAGALFDEEPLIRGTSNVRLEIRNAERGDTGLLLLVLKDLLSGDLTVGGNASIGRGAFRGKAKVTADGKTIAIGSDMKADEVAAIDGWIDDFKTAIRRTGEAS